MHSHHPAFLKEGRWLTKVSDLPEVTQAVNGVRIHTQACKTPTEALSLCETEAGSGQAPKGTRRGPQQLRLESQPGFVLTPHGLE